MSAERSEHARNAHARNRAPGERSRVIAAEGRRSSPSTKVEREAIDPLRTTPPCARRAGFATSARSHRQAGAFTAFLLVLLAGCAPTRTVSLTFGSEGEGLDGFMCKDDGGRYLLERRPADGAASLVFDFIALQGVPGCRTGQLLEWCKNHDCSPLPAARSCVPVQFEAPDADRETLRAQLQQAMRAVRGQEAIGDAPDEFVLVRVVGTTETCEQVLSRSTKEPLVTSQLLGCAYSCPVLLDRVDQAVYLGFDGFVGKCAQGVLICSAEQLSWRTQ